MSSLVSFGSRKYACESKGDIDYSKPKKHTAAKVVVGTAVALAAIKPGLMLGHKTGMFVKAKNFFDKKLVSCLDAGGENFTSLKNKRKGCVLTNASTYLEKLDNAGKLFLTNVKEEFKAVKKVFSKPISMKEQ